MNANEAGPSPTIAPTLTAAAPPADGNGADIGRVADSMLLGPRQAEALVRTIEVATAVHRRYQFFVWTQSQVHVLLPHQVLVCGAYQRQQRSVVYEAFHSVVLPPEVLQPLTDPGSALLRAVVDGWIEARHRPLLFDLRRALLPERAENLALLHDFGAGTVLVHGVARPQRPAEIETLFLFLGLPPTCGSEQLLQSVDLLLPHLHSTWLRVQAAERDMPQAAPPRARPPQRETPAPTRGITERERQILLWVRDGRSNQQIGEVLGISPLTVKNHIQKILRKLGAANRAQAVAQAMQHGLLDVREPQR
jgi:transcriptional regulator EpsA